MHHRTTLITSLDNRYDPTVGNASRPDAPVSSLSGDYAPTAEERDEEALLRARALDGEVDALMQWRQLVEPIDYEELGWGD